MKKSAVFIGITLLTAVFLTLSCQVGLGDAVDTEAPQFEITNPPINSIIRGDFNIQGTFTDDGEIDFVDVVLENTSNKELKYSYKGTFDAEAGTWKNLVTPVAGGIKDGSYQVSVTMEDKAGHKTVQTRQITVDNTAPIIVLQRPSSLATATTDIDGYGQKFTLTGQAADDNNVSLIELSVYADAAQTQLLTTIPLTNVPPTIEIDAAEFKEGVENTYSKIYQSTSKNGPKKLYCSLKAYDGAQSYPTSGENQTPEDLKGNCTSYYYLYEQISSSVLSTYKVTDLYKMFSGNYQSNEATKSATDIVASVQKLLADKKITAGSFTLNPANNPSFAVSGHNPLSKDGADFADTNVEHNVSNNSNIVVEVSTGLDAIPLDAESLKVCFVECDDNCIELPGATKIYPTESAKTKSGTSYRFVTKVAASDGLRLGHKYIIHVDGKDEKNNEIVGAGNGYGFKFVSSGAAPNVTVETSINPDPINPVYQNNAIIYVPRMNPANTAMNSTFRVKGTVVVEEETPEFHIYIDGVEVPGVTLEPGVEEHSYNFSHDISTSTIAEVDGNIQHSLEIKATSGLTTTVTKTLMCDGAGPVITIQEVTPIAYNYEGEDGTVTQKATGGNEQYLNGRVNIKFTIMDTDDTVDVSTPEIAPKVEFIQDNAPVTALTKTNILNLVSHTEEIDTTQLADNKDVIIRITAYDRAGNKTITTESTTNAMFKVLQATDNPVILPENAGTGTVLNSYNDVIAETNTKNIFTANGQLKLKFIDDDGIQSFYIYRKKLTDSPTSYELETIHDSAYKDNEISQATVPGNPTTYSSSIDVGANTGFYSYGIEIKDTQNNTILKGPFFIHVVPASPIVNLESTQYITTNTTGVWTGTDMKDPANPIQYPINKVETKIDIESTEKPFRIMRSLFEINATEPASGDDYIVDNNGGTISSLPANATTDYYTSSYIGNSKSYKLKYFVTDKNNKTGTKVTTLFKIDNKKPEIKIDNPSENYSAGSIIGLYDSTVTFKGTASDNPENNITSGLNKIQYNFDNGSWVEDKIEASKNWYLDVDFLNYNGANFAEGIHTLNVRAIDGVGNLSLNDVNTSRSFMYDRSIPSLTITNSVPTQTNTGFTVSGKAWDSNEITKVNIYINGTLKDTINFVDKPKTEPDADNFSKEFVVGSSNAGAANYLPDGNNTIIVEAVDVAGRTKQISKEISVDTTKPVTLNITALPEAVETQSSSYTFQGTAQDNENGSGIKEVLLTISDKTGANYKTVRATGTQNWSYTLSFASETTTDDIDTTQGHTATSWKSIFYNNTDNKAKEGEKVVKVSVIDNIGNIKQSFTVGGSSTGVTTDAATDISTTTFIYDVANPTSSISGIQTYMPSVGYTISGTAEDSYKLSKIIIKEKKDGTLTGDDKEIPVPEANGTSYNWSQALPINGTVSGDGEYSYELWIYDAAGNEVNFKNFTTTVDTTPPVLTVSYPSGKTTVDAITETNSRFNGTVTESHLEKIYYKILLANETAPTAPSAADVLTESAWTGAGWTSVTAGTGTWNFYQQFTDAAASTSTELREGSYKLYVYAVDEAANLSTRVTEAFDVDMNPPVLTQNLAAASTGKMYTDTSSGITYFKGGLTLTAGATDTNAMATTNPLVVKLGGNTVTGSGGTYTFAESSFTEGTEKTLEITATDIFGKTTVKTYSLVLDKTAPAVTITNPDNDLAGEDAISWTGSGNGSYTFRATVNDACSGVMSGTDKNKYKYLITQTELTTPAAIIANATATATAGNWTYATGQAFSAIKTLNAGTSATTAGNLFEGKWYLYIYAKDALETEGTASRSFYVDKEAPVLSTKLDNDELTSSTTQTVTSTGFVVKFKATDTYGLDTTFGTNGVNLEINKNGTEITTETSNPIYYTIGGVDANGYYPITLTGATDDVYTYVITAKDKAGKQVSVTRSVRLDTAGPTIELTSPTFDASGKSEWNTTSNVKVMGTADDVSGIGAVYVKMATTAPTLPSSGTATGQAGVEATWTGAGWTKATGTTNWNATFQNVPDSDNNKIYIAAVDSKGNVSARVDRILQKDSTAPEITEALGLTVKTINTSNSSTGLILSGTMNDVTSGLKSLTITDDKNSSSKWEFTDLSAAVSNTTQTWTLPAAGAAGTWSQKIDIGNATNKLKDGTHVLSLYLVDNAGNSTTIQRSILVDTKAPTVANMSVTTAADYTDASSNKWFKKNTVGIKIRGIIDEENHGIGSASGINAVEYSTNANAAEADQIWISMSKAANPNNAETGIVAGSYDYTANVNCTEQGLNTISVRVTDATGNKGEPREVPVYIDTLIPAEAEVVKIDDSTSSLANTKLVNGSLDVTVYIYTKDDGISAASGIGSVKLAKVGSTAPTHTTSGYTNGTQYSFMWYSDNNTPETTDDDYVYTLSATPDASATVYTDELCTSGATSATYSSTNKTITVGTGASARVYNLVPGAGVWKVVINKDDLKTGTAIFDIKDNSGNGPFSYYAFQIQLDNKFPDAKITVVPTAVNKEIVIGGVASDDQSFGSVKLQYQSIATQTSEPVEANWLDYGTPSSDSSWSVTIDTTDTTKFTDNSWYAFRAVATDSAENTGNSGLRTNQTAYSTDSDHLKTLYINQDGDRPVIKFTNMSLGSTMSSSTPQGFEQSELQGSISDDDGIPTSVEYKLGAAGTYAAIPNYSTVDGGFRLSLDDGSQDIYFRITDRNNTVFESDVVTTVSGLSATPKLTDNLGAKYAYTDSAATNLNSLLYVTIDTTPPEVDTIKYCQTNSATDTDWNINIPSVIGGTENEVYASCYAYDVNNVKRSHIAIPVNAGDTNPQVKTSWSYTVSGITTTVYTATSNPTAGTSYYAASDFETGTTAAAGTISAIVPDASDATKVTKITIGTGSDAKTLTKDSYIFSLEKQSDSDDRSGKMFYKWKTETPVDVQNMKTQSRTGFLVVSDGIKETKSSINFNIDYTAPVITFNGPSSTDSLSGSVTAYGSVDSSGTLEYAVSTSGTEKPSSGRPITTWNKINQDGSLTPQNLPASITGSSMYGYKPIEGANISWFVYFDNDTSSSGVHEKLLKDYLVNYGITTEEALLSTETPFEDFVQLFIWIKATDTVGNVSETCKEVIFDPQGDKPTVQYGYPGENENGIVLGGEIRLSGTATDLLGSNNDKIGVESVWAQFISSNHSYKQNAGQGADWPSTGFGTYTVGTTEGAADYNKVTAFNLTKADLDYMKNAGYHVYNMKTYHNEATHTEYNGTIASGYTPADYAARLTLSSSSWSSQINGKKEFDVSSGTNGVAIRVYAQDKDGKFSLPSDKYVRFDAQNPVIGNRQRLYLIQSADNTIAGTLTNSGNLGINFNTTSSIEYQEDMFVRGTWWLIGSVEDNDTIHTLKINGDELVVTSDVGTTTLKTDANWKVVQSPDKKTVCFKYKLGTGSGVGNLDFNVDVWDAASPNQGYTSKPMKLSYDNMAPELVGADDASYNINPKIKQSDGFYTFGSKVSEPVQGTASQSGLDYVAFYFLRRNTSSSPEVDSIYNPMLSSSNATTINASTILMSAATSSTANGTVVYDSGLYWTKQTVTRTADLNILGVTTNDNIRVNGLVKIGGAIYKITAKTASSVTLNGNPPQSDTLAFFANAMVVDNTVQENGSNSKLDNGYPATVSNDDGDGMVEYVKKSGASWTWSCDIVSRNIPDGPIELHYVAFDAAGNYSIGIAGNKGYSEFTGNPSLAQTKDLVDFISLKNNTNRTSNVLYVDGAGGKSYYNGDTTGTTITNTNLREAMFIRNNGPRLAGVKIWTDYNGDGTEQSDEVKTKYYSESQYIISGNITKRSSDLTELLVVSGNDKDYTLDSSNNTGNAYMTIRDSTTFTPEIVGGNGNLYYSYKIGSADAFRGTAGASYKLNDKNTTSFATGHSQVEPNEYKASAGYVEGYTDGHIVFNNFTSLETNSTTAAPTWFEYKIWDSTEGTTTFTDSLYATMRIALKVQYFDDVKPVVKIQPFYWYKNASGTILSSVPYDSTNKKYLGHIDLEDGLSTSLLSSGHKPKVSGEVEITGFAYDDIKLDSLHAEFDDISTLGSGNTNATLSYTSSGWASKITNATDNWSFEAEDVYADATGHMAKWTLKIDTSKIANTVGLDKKVKVVATDARGGNTSLIDTNTTAKLASFFWKDVKNNTSKTYYTNMSRKTVANASNCNDDTVVYENVFIYRWKNVKDETGATSNYYTDINCTVNATSTTNDNTNVYRKVPSYQWSAVKNNTGVVYYKNDTCSEIVDRNEVSDTDTVYTDLMTSAYSMDVVPYITGINSTLTNNAGSEFGRSALGYYDVRDGETITINGFNLKSGSTAPTVKINGSSGNNYFQISSSATSKITGTIGSSAVSGKLEIVANNITSINNENTNPVAANDATEFTETSDALYNSQANGKNNNRLTDDVELHIWNKDGYFVSKTDIVDPRMKMLPNGNYYMIYDNNMKDGVGTTKSAYQLVYDRNGTKNSIDGGYNKWVHNALTVDENGNLFGVSTNTDRVGNTAAKYKIFCNDTINGNYGTSDYQSEGSNSKILEYVYNATTLVYDVDRVPRSKMVSKKATSGTNVALIYFDHNHTQKPVKFRYGNINSSTFSGGFEGGSSSGCAQSGSNVTSNQTGTAKNFHVIADSTTGMTYHGGDYSSTGITKDGYAVVAWYDASSKSLMYSYNTTPNTPTYGGVWQTHAKVIDDDYAGWYVDMFVDSKDGIHIAYYASGKGDLRYAYLPSYNCDADDIKVVTVDSYLSAGTNITIETRNETVNNVNYIVPYISYYHASFAQSPSSIRVAYMPKAISYSGSTVTANIYQGAVDDLFTGRWEVEAIPTPNVPIEDLIGLGLPNTDNTTYKNSPVLGFKSDKYGYEKAYIKY